MILMRKKLLTAVGLLIVTGILFIVVVENYAIYSQHHLANIEVLKIGTNTCSVKLSLKPAKALNDRTTKIPLTAKEGPFWIEVDTTLPDLRICSCRTTWFTVVYSCFDIPDGKEKSQILHLVESETVK